ncbi:MAG: HD domain-containing phosphohydrolase [Alphaproteobacteria bacterium]
MTDVLVIAASVSERKALVGALEAGAVRAIGAASGKDALKQVAGRAPGLIVCDLSARTGKVLETVRRLRAQAETAHIPILVLSDDGNAAGLAGSLGLAPADCLAKPVSTRELLAAVKARLAERGVVRERAPVPEARLATALDGVDVGFMLFDGDGRLVMCNSRACDMLKPVEHRLQAGVPFADISAAMVDVGMVDRGGGEAGGWLRDRLDRHGAPGGAFEQRLTDGRWLRVRECALGDGGLVSILTDITEVKRRERRLREGERRFRKLTEIGIALSAEKNVSRLLELILIEAKAITNADAGTIYLRVDGDEDTDLPLGARVDPRAGGDRRIVRERRNADLDPAEPADLDHRRERDDRREGEDRRLDTGRLAFAIVRNDTLGIAMGGTTGETIPYPSVPLFDADSGGPNDRNVATLVALRGATVNIPDAYAAEEFDFSGTRVFDARFGYRSTSFLTVPMKNKADEVTGVLQLINARDEKTGAVVPFDREHERVVEALASQAAVAIENQLLLEGQKNLLGSFIQLIAGAIDEKSPYTGGHCERVPVLTEMLAEAACEAEAGPFKDFSLDEDERYELHIAAWLHDCGKVTTPEHVVDKATKLETVYDRIGTVSTRFEVLKRDAEIDHLRRLAEDGADRTALEAEFRARIGRLDADRAFLHEVNIGGEYMDPEKQDRVRRIAKLRWRGPDGKERDLLSDDEVYNLCVSRGTLTPEERQVVNDHILVTIDMLNKLPFPKGLTRVPEYAGGHHEKMDGSGYPRGLRREQMSVPARMMAIADIFEALTADDRPYKNAKTLSESMSIMARMRDDNDIDPDLFELFVVSGVYRRYAERFLDPEQIDELDHDAVLGRPPRAAGGRRT